MLWLIFILLTGCAVLSILWPLMKAPRGESQAASEIALYKTRLAEIDRDAAQGLLAAEDAQGAKAEAARRLMASKAPAEEAAPAQGSQRRAAFIAAAIFAPVLAVGLYGIIGRPALPDQPLSARLQTAPARDELMAAVEKIEAHLAQHPDDGRGYEVLAPVYLHMGRAEEAARAFASALRLLGETPQRLALYGEALVVSANGVVTGQARQAFEKASAGDPSLAKPRFFLGLAAEQSGDISRAREIWTGLLAEAPEAAAWTRALRERVAALPGGAGAAEGAPADKPSLAARI